MEKTFLRPTVIFFLLILAFASTAAQDKPPQTNNAGAIRGRVVNESGQPLYDVIVSLRPYGSSDIRRAITTDRDGTFKFTELPAVVYLLSAGLPAYTLAPRDPDSNQSTSYRVGDNVTLLLIKGGVITGKVTNSSGEPVVGVRVRAQTIRDSFGERPRSTAGRETITDDRGVYRIYGLPTGTYLTMAGGGVNGLVSYRNDAPTYAPASTRETAAEVSVQAGQETSDVDIRYRGEQGHVVTGLVTGPPGSDRSPSIVTLSSTMDAGLQWGETTFQSSQSDGFSFLGVPDGDYDVTAQSFTNLDRSLSAPKRISVRDADVTGIEFIPKPLASINGRVVLEESNALECKGQRRAIVTETLISAWHDEKEAAKDQPQFIWSLGGPVYPNEQGEIALRSLAAGQYQIIGRLAAKYWYLRSITLPAPIRNAVVTPPSSKPVDAVANWITLRSGERLSGLTVTLSEGAGSLQGQIKLNEGQTLPARLYVYLVPTERENEQDLLRYLAAPITPDRKIAVNHIPPGRYRLVTQPALEGARPTLTTLRLPDERETRTRLRRDAEQAKIEIEIKPCQNVTDYDLSLRTSATP